MMFKSEDSEGGGDTIAGEKKKTLKALRRPTLSLHADMEEDNSQDPKKRELLGGEARDIPDIAEKNVLGF